MLETLLTINVKYTLKIFSKIIVKRTKKRYYLKILCFLFLRTKNGF